MVQKNPFVAESSRWSSPATFSWTGLLSSRLEIGAFCCTVVNSCGQEYSYGFFALECGSTRPLSFSLLLCQMRARCAHLTGSEQRERFFLNGPAGQVGQGLSALVRHKPLLICSHSASTGAAASSSTTAAAEVMFFSAKIFCRISRATAGFSSR